MDKKFLHKVLDQIVSETIIDYDGITYPFPFPSSLSPPPFLSPPYQFYGHCMSVYGLNEEEITYVWEKYRKIIYKI